MSFDSLTELVPLSAWNLLAQTTDTIAAPEVDYTPLFRLLMIFTLAVFVGFEIITKIPQTLHTPLMSGSNAISGITILGALVITGQSSSTFAQILGWLAVVMAMTNVVGGFLVTHRMLSKFQSRK